MAARDSEEGVIDCPAWRHSRSAALTGCFLPAPGAITSEVAMYRLSIPLRMTKDLAGTPHSCSCEAGKSKDVNIFWRSHLCKIQLSQTLSQSKHTHPFRRVDYPPQLMTVFGKMGITTCLLCSSKTLFVSNLHLSIGACASGGWCGRVLAPWSLG